MYKSLHKAEIMHILRLGHFSGSCDISVMKHLSGFCAGTLRRGTCDTYIKMSSIILCFPPFDSNTRISQFFGFGHQQMPFGLSER